MDPSVLKIGLVDIYLSRKKILADRNMPRTNIEDQLILCAKYVKA